MTQETDRNHGPFKAVHRRNLKKLARDGSAKGSSTSFANVDFGLLVFGGVNAVAGIGGCQNAFAKAFSVERNKRSWEVVGAAPLTMKCLNSDKVRHLDETDPNFSKYRRIETRGTSQESNTSKRSKRAVKEDLKDRRITTMIADLTVLR